MIIMIMIDGFGIPPEGWKDSVFADSFDRFVINLFEEHSIGIDTCMGIDGIPQSATGQTAIFTGINAAEKMNAHIQGFPSKKLREIIRSRNIFLSLINKNKRVAFANAYVRFNIEKLKKLGLRSVTTVMTEYTLGYVRNSNHLLAGEAVYHDITRHTISDGEISPVSPETAAHTLLNIARQNDFTLFEYFLTDKAGHAGNPKLLATILKDLNNFIACIVKSLRNNETLILTSDHGNCEDMSTKKHTRNKVPFLVINARQKFNSVKSITDIHDYIMTYFPEN